MSDTIIKHEPSESYKLYRELKDSPDLETEVEILKDLLLQERAETAKLWGIIKTMRAKNDKSE